MCRPYGPNMSCWRSEEHRSRAQRGEIQALRRIHDVAESLTTSLEGELQREGDRAKVLLQEVRAERDVTDRHETESRLLMIKVRNLDGVAGTVQAVVKEYHLLEAQEHRAVQSLERARYELHPAGGAVAMISQARAIEASRDPLAALGPGRVVISVEEDERRSLIRLVCPTS